MEKLKGEAPLVPFFSCGPRHAKWIGLLLILLQILSCSGLPIRDNRPRGVYHRVKSGETLFAIARAYRVNLQELAEANDIRDPEKIEAGSVIFVPEADQIVEEIVTVGPPRERASVAAQTTITTEATNDTAAVAKEPPKNEAPVVAGTQPQPAADTKAKGPPVSSPPAARKDLSPSKRPEEAEEVKPAGPPARAKASEEKPEKLLFDKSRFIWPVKGRVVSTFGNQPNRMYFNGIRIAAGDGTPVFAAADGVVIFSAALKNYGETIIIRHEDHYATVYAGLGVRTVREEAKVKKGDRIAFIGKASGGDRESFLHFEVRQNNKARNPLFFLP